MEQFRAPYPGFAPTSMLAYVEDMLMELADLAVKLEREPLALAIRDAAAVAREEARANEAAGALPCAATPAAAPPAAPPPKASPPKVSPP